MMVIWMLAMILTVMMRRRLPSCMLSDCIDGRRLEQKTSDVEMVDIKYDWSKPMMGEGI